LKVMNQDMTGDKKEMLLKDFMFSVLGREKALFSRKRTGRKTIGELASLIMSVVLVTAMPSSLAGCGAKKACTL